jgi:PAS domain S-box-containing protein
MTWQLTPYLFPTLAAVAVSVLVVIFAWRHGDYPGARPLTVLALGAAWWSLTYVVGLATTDPTLKLFAYKLAYPAIGIIPVAWVVFAIEYTGRLRVPTRRELGGLLLVPASVVLLVWTFEHHGLIWSSVELLSVGSGNMLMVTWGTGFWLWAIYTYALLGIGTGLILQTALSSEEVYRTQAITLALAAIIPWASNALYLTGLSKVWDPTPVGIALSGGLLLVPMSQRRLLQTVPGTREVARNELLDTMRDAVIVIDAQKQVVDLNPAAEALLGRSSAAAIGRQIEGVFPALAEAIDLRVNTPDRVELTLPQDDDERHYEIQCVPVEKGYGTITGQLLTVRDITERQQRDNLDVLNQVLRHDIRNDLQVVLAYAEMLAENCDDEEQDYIERILESATHAVDLTTTAREMAELLLMSGGDRQQMALRDTLDSELKKIESTRPEVALTVKEPIPETTVMANDMLDSVFRNLLENAVQHNDNPEPEVTVSGVACDDVVIVRVADNGPGVPDSHKDLIFGKGERGFDTTGTGIGLYLVRTLVEGYGGDVWVEDNDPDGAVFVVELPKASPDNGAETSSRPPTQP